MRILCCCAGGNTRSVTLATLLKYNHRGRHDAVACSLECNRPETLAMLYGWAELIIVVEEDMAPLVPVEYRHKLIVVPLGPDEWGMSMHPELIPLAVRRLAEAGFETNRTPAEIIARRKKYADRAEETKTRNAKLASLWLRLRNAAAELEEILPVEAVDSALDKDGGV